MALPTQEQLLAALGAAHDAGDQDSAIHIAQMISDGQYAPSVAAKDIQQPSGNTSGSAGKPSLGSSLFDAYKNAVAGPVEGAAHVASGMLAGPVAGYAGAGADIAHALGANVDPADVVRKTQNALTYSPRTAGGQATANTIDAIGGVIPQGANWAGEHVTDATGSPALGAATNTGLQALGMYGMGKIPAVAASAPVQRTINLASDYLPGGANRAASRLINQYANDTPNGGRAAALDAVQAHNDAQTALSGAARSGALAEKYGLRPTGTQVAQSPGLAQLDRSIRTQGPDVAAPLNAADTANRGAIVDILKGISGTPEQRLRAGATRDFNARTAYDDALNNPDHFVQPPSPTDPTFAAEAAAKQGLTQDGTPPVNDPNAPAQGLNSVGERLQEVLQRPAMQTAMQNAKMQAANRGVQLNDRNLMQQLHYSKLDLDGQIGAASRSGDSTTMGGLLDTKNTLLGVMDDLSPAYKNARQGFTADSAPINRMDVGEALRQKYLSALQDSSGTGSRPSMLLDALRRDDGDTLAQQATGFNSATLQKTLTPDDLASLDAARTQLGREAFTQNSGRGVGSNTGQNIANQRNLDSVGDMSAPAGNLGAIGAVLHHPAISIPLGMRGNAVRAAAQKSIANTLSDPTALAQTLQQKYTNRIPDSVAIPAAVGVNQASQPEGHADGGPVDSKGNPIKPASFWDLVQTAIHELTTPDDPSPQNAPLGSGAASNAAQQIQANPHNIMASADAQS
jgi:hypothetical protein